MGGTPRHLNPAVQSGIWTGQPGAQLFATPLRFDESSWHARSMRRDEYTPVQYAYTSSATIIDG